MSKWIRHAEQSSDRSLVSFWRIGKVESPHWSYQLGLAEGWLPSDPRSAAGTCAKQGIVSPLGAPLSGYQTGGPGAGTFPPDQISSYGDWPPSSMSGLIDGITGVPVYVATGAPVTLTAPSPTYPASYSPTASVTLGNGWADSGDTALAYVPIDGCSYPNPWSASNSPYPACTPSVQKRRGEQAPAAVVSVTATATSSSAINTITPKPVRS